VETAHEPLHLRQTKFGALKAHGHIYKFYLNYYFIWRSFWEAKFSSNLCVQTGSGDHPASCTMGTGGPFPGARARPWHDADHSSPSSAEVENE
jgi:hypothetical protein